MKTLTAIILDTFFIAFGGFLLLIVFLSYYFRPPLSILFSVILSLLFTLLYLKLSLDKNQKQKLSKEEKKQKEFILNQLKLYTKTEQNDFFENLIKTFNKEVERKKGGLFIKNTDYAVFSFFSFDAIKKSDIVKVFNSISKSQKAIILSENFSEEIKNFADRFDGRISTVDGNELFIKLKEKEFLPKEKLSFPEKKPFDFSPLQNLLKKKKAKNFLLFGFLFILMSYFAPFKTYYIVSGSLFLIYSLILRIYGKKETT